jgi:hypothetical protein
LEEGVNGAVEHGQKGVNCSRLILRHGSYLPEVW